VARHAPVAVRGVCYGQSDVPTEIDHEAAAKRIVAQLAEAASAFPFAVGRIWASPWERTRGLAEALGARLATPVEIDPRLSELSFGRWEGGRYAEIEVSDGERFRAWMADWQRAAPPEGECIAELVLRVQEWRREVGERSGIAITHAGPIRALRALERGVEYEAVAAEAVEFLTLEPSSRSSRLPAGIARTL
jgi:alpha-ribazole phosphatase